MKLKSIDGKYLELNIVGLQFPESPNVEIQYSWLMIDGGAESENGEWTFRWQALTSSEPLYLADWFEAVGRAVDINALQLRRIEFTEPNIMFAVEDYGPYIQIEVTFDQEFLPPWRSRPPCLGRQLESLSLRLERAQLFDAAQVLRANLYEYVDPSLGIL